MPGNAVRATNHPDPRFKTTLDKNINLLFSPSVMTSKLFVLAVATVLCAPLVVRAQDGCPKNLQMGFNVSGTSTKTLLGTDWKFTRYVTAIEDGPFVKFYEPITIKAGDK